MRSVVLRSLAVISVGGLLLAGVLYVASTVDARAPEVVEIRLTQPAAGDGEAALITTSLEVHFSEPVDEDSARDAFTIRPVVEGAVSWSGSTMIFTPLEPLDLESEYAVTVGPGVTDPAGNEMTELPPPFTFVTAGRPSLVSSEPGDGATDVAVDAPIRLVFSSLMDTASVEEELRIRPSFRHELRWSGEILEIVPIESLRPGAEYEVSVQSAAADVAGVALDAPIEIAFRTTPPGLAADLLVPADGVDGVAVTSPIAIVFDRPVDPATVSADLVTITPDVAGTLEVVALPGETPVEEGSGRALRFTPSAALPPNTTFSVEVDAGIGSIGDGELPARVEWSFTTGAPITGISNQITFVSDRAGIPNVWAMNPDGTGQRQLSVELVPVVDYAVAPDGSSLVVADGRRLVYQRPDGTDRRVLTDPAHLEFDPAYAPNSGRVVFGRADAETGVGLGLWVWEVNAGDATRVELPPALDGQPDVMDRQNLRAPRYAPDGQALAFVDLDGHVGLVELPGQRLTLVPFHAGAAPTWLPDAAGLVLTGSSEEEEPTPSGGFTAPVLPLEPAPDHAVHRLARSGTRVAGTPLGDGSRVLAVSGGGLVAYVDADGALFVTETATLAAGEPTLDEATVVGAAFAPGGEALVVATGGTSGTLELVDAEGTRTELARGGSQPRWLP